MKRNVFLLSCLLLCTALLQAQYQEITKEQQDEIVGRMAQAADGMTTLQGEFVQVKELSFMNDRITSEGKIYYKKADKIRWEYTKPYIYVFSTDGTQVHLTSGDKTSRMPVKSSRLFGELSKVMTGGISGHGLIDSPDFEARFMAGKDDYKVILTPKKKEVKDLFSSIQLYVGKPDGRIRTVELTEKSCDRTTITLKNVQENTAISDDLFSK